MAKEILRTEKEIKDFIKKLETINQSIKNIYCDETNFFPEYILFRDKAIYAHDFTIPNVLLYKFEDLITEVGVHVIVNSKQLFDFLKFKKEIKSITIEEDFIGFSINENSGQFAFKITDNQIIANKIKVIANTYTVQQIEDTSPIASISISKKIIQDFVENKKDIIKYYIDIDNDKFTKRKPQIDNYLPISLSGKFLNAYYYKIKHLKKGDVEDYTPISLYVYNSNLENFYTLNFTVHTKFGRLEHYLIICDY